MAYVSKKKQIQEEIDRIFNVTEEVDRNQLNLRLLRKYGASTNQVDQILEVFSLAGELYISSDVVRKAGKEQ